VVNIHDVTSEMHQLYVSMQVPGAVDYSCMIIVLDTEC